MNKILLSSATIAAMLTVISCSNDNTITNEPAQSAGSQTITLVVADAQGTRAGRPLQSSEAAQAVENVRVLVVSPDGEIVWTKLLDSWNSANTSKPLQSVASEQGREATIEIPKDECYLDEGVAYDVYAYGYSNFSDYDLSAIASVEVGETFNPDFTVSITKGIGEEIFAGRSEIVGSPVGTSTELILGRQVAGTYGYFENIPYAYDPATRLPGRYLTLMASNPQTTMVMGMFGAEYAVNGVKSADADIIYTIDLADWFIDIVEGVNEDGVKTGVIAAGDNWKGRGDNPELRFARGSVFAGEFIIPFQKTDQPTFRLILSTDAEGVNVLRSWDVLLPDSEMIAQTSEYYFWYCAQGKWSRRATTDTDRVYNVLRNHLYGLGKHPFETLAAGGDPNDPNYPGEDAEDQPISLNNKQDIGLVVNHNWNAIYLMEID